MVIPPSSLNAETLNSVLEEFISREGTDYGETELSLEEKVALLKPQVLRGEVVIMYDEDLQTINLMPKNQLTFGQG